MATQTTSRRIPLVLATEAAVEVFDPPTAGFVNEVLRVDGIAFGDRVPLLDSHKRDVANTLGSIRELAVVRTSAGPELRGVAHFSSGPRATEVFRLYDEGHLSDFSIGAQRLELERQENGDRVVTRSLLVEGSAVVRGADPSARVISQSARQQTQDRQWEASTTAWSKRRLAEIARRNELLLSGDWYAVHHDREVLNEFRRLCRDRPDRHEFDNVRDANVIVRTRREVRAEEKSHASQANFFTQMGPF